MDARRPFVVMSPHMPTGSSQPQASMPEKEIVKVLISIDPGTAYMKACFKAFTQKETQSPRIGVDTNVLQGIRPVAWPGSQQYVPVQIAYRLENMSRTSREPRYRQIWGHEVTEAIEQETIIGHQAQTKYKSLIESQIDALPEAIRFSACDEKGDTRRLTCFDLYSDFMGHAWRFILRRIKQEYPTIPWPPLSRWTRADAHLTFAPEKLIPVEVVIPLPANSRPHHVQLAVQAARRAKMPAPYPVAEPAAAYAFDIQSSTESHGPVSESSCNMIVDIGCGSVDLQLWSIMQTSPLRVREEVEGADGWCGGNRVNEECRRIVHDDCVTKWDKLFRGFVQAQRPSTFSHFLDEVEAKFEMKKQNFGDDTADYDDTVLAIMGVPDVPHSRLRRNQLRLSSFEVRQAFDASFAEIKTLIDNLIERFERTRTHEGAVKQINEILLVGGGSANPYLSERIRREYENGDHGASASSICVRTRNLDQFGAASCVVQGALLLLMDRVFLRERVIRRGYCVKIDEEATPGMGGCGKHNTRLDPHDGVWRRTDVTRFLIRIGQRIGHSHRAVGPRGCWRGLFLDEKTPDGWFLDEEILCSDTISDDGVWVNGRESDIHPCGMLRFLLPDEDCASFETRRSPINGRRYKYLEYHVEFVIEGIVMTYQVTIPREGKFLRLGVGPDPIRKIGQLDCAGVFELFNSV